jgi:SAM-dependent methyltransferase
VATTERKPLGASYWKSLATPEAVGLSEATQKLLICPDDDAPVEYYAVDRRYLCPVCRREFPQADGGLSLLPTQDGYRLSSDQISRVSLAAVGNSQATGDARLLAALLRPAGDLKGKVALDLCCGTGWAAAALAQAGATVIAADIAVGEGGLASARARRDSASLSFDLLQVDSCRVPLAAQAFDLIFVGDALALHPRPERLAMEIGRLLRPEGMFLSFGEPLGVPLPPQWLATDDRLAGRRLGQRDYEAIFREGGMELEAIFADDSGTPPKGILAKFARHWRTQHSTEPRAFIGRPIAEFRLPILRDAITRKVAQHAD